MRIKNTSNKCYRMEVYYMLVSKTIQIEFTDSSIQAADAIYDIRKAAESASLNLNL